MGISFKMNSIFIGIIILLGILLVSNYQNIKEIDSNQKYALGNTLSHYEEIHDLRYNIANKAMTIHSYYINPSSDTRSSFTESAKTVTGIIKNIDEMYTKNGVDSKTFNELKEANKRFDTSVIEFTELVDKGESGKALTVLNENITENSDSMYILSNEILASVDSELQEVSDKTDKSVTTSKRVSFTISIFSFLVIVFEMYYVRKTIINPMKLVIDRALLISTGDLKSEPLTIKGKDEMGQMARAFNDMQSNIRRLVNNIKGSAEQLNHSAEGLTGAVQMISRSSSDVRDLVTLTDSLTKENLQSSEQTVSAMSENSEGIQNIADSANNLANNTSGTTQSANHGEAVIGKAKAQMNSIKYATTQVSDLVDSLTKQTAEIGLISKTISDITDQTNLLALNASIEAARAGEHGKGFAVVADEVKKLAEQSKSSAVSIGNLIRDIQKDTEGVGIAVNEAIDSVKTGVLIIDEAGTSFSAIRVAIEDMLTQISDISATSEQLAAGAEEVTASIETVTSASKEVSRHISDVDLSVNEQIVNMQEIGHVADEVSQSARNLKTEISRFKI